MNEIEEALYTALRELTSKFIDSENMRKEDNEAVSEALLTLKNSVNKAANLSEQVERSAELLKGLIQSLDDLSRVTAELTQQNVIMSEEMNSLLQQNQQLAERVTQFETFIKDSARRS